MNWIALSFLSLLMTGVGNFFFRLATQAGQSPMSVVMLVFMMNALIAAGIWLFYRPVVINGAGPVGWPVLAGLSTGAGIFLLILAMAKPEAKAGVAAAIMNVNFLVVALLSWLFCQETLSPKQLLGMLAVVSGLLLLL